MTYYFVGQNRKEDKEVKRKILAFVLFVMILVASIAPAALAATTWTSEVMAFSLTREGNSYTGNCYAIQRFMFLKGGTIKAALGGTTSDVDGAFGSKTTAAVKAFQSLRGNLNVDGKVGAYTWEALYSETNEVQNTYTYLLNAGSAEASALGMSTVMYRLMSSNTWRSYDKNISVVTIY